MKEVISISAAPALPLRPATGVLQRPWPQPSLGSVAWMAGRLAIDQ